MKRYKPINLNKIKTYPIKERKTKVDLFLFAKEGRRRESFREFTNSLPKILAAEDIKKVVKAIVKAKRKAKPVIFGLGAHVIKVGLSPIIIDLMKKRIISAVALNGAGAIHDFEMALMGETSEDVTEGLKYGKFGMVKETGELMNEAISTCSEDLGIGEALGKKIIKMKFKFRRMSILAQGVMLSIPITVHVGIGTDTIHMHPNADPSSYGIGSFTDFRLLASIVSNLEGGIYVNCGSAVILPEVFLKALTVARNLGAKVSNFVTVNMDMKEHYRPRENVILRPGGKGYNLIGHHEIMIPLLAQMITEEVGG